jgi:hypothetical protein
MFSATVMSGTIISSWKIVTIPLRRASPGELKKHVVPAHAHPAGLRLHIAGQDPISVDFPAPFSPTSA